MSSSLLCSESDLTPLLNTEITIFSWINKFLSSCSEYLCRLQIFLVFILLSNGGSSVIYLTLYFYLMLCVFEGLSLFDTLVDVLGQYGWTFDVLCQYGWKFRNWLPNQSVSISISERSYSQVSHVFFCSISSTRIMNVKHGR